MQELPALLQSFGIDLKKTGKSYKCKCYTHVDNDPSMSVYKDENGKWWAHCHVCTETHHDAIATYMHFTGCDFKTADHDLQTGICKKGKKSGTITESPPVVKGNVWQHSIPTDNSIPDMEFKHIGKPVKVWTYRLADGVIIGYVARYENDGKKDYRPFSFGTMSDNLKPSWQSKSWSTPRPIYNADKLANSTGQIVVTEGEKTADAAEKLFPASVTCITWPGGSGGVRHADWSALKGRNAILVPDADPSGIAAMEWLAKHLLGDIKALSVSVIDTSDQPLGWDLADAVDDGWDTAQTIAWAKEHKNSASLEPVDTQAAKQAAIERAISMEKKTPENIPPTLSIVQSENIIIESEVHEQDGSNVRKIRSRLELAPAMPEEFSELALAKLWLDEFGEHWRYIEAWNCWMQWVDGRWEIDKLGSVTRTTADAMARASNLSIGKSTLTAGNRRTICSRKNIANVLSIAGEYKKILPESLDSDPFLLGTPGGIIDLRTGDIRPAKPDDLITKMTKVTPKRGDMPHWEKSVLDRCTNGCNDMREYYQRWIGYMLTGDCREEGFIFIHGAGGSGKSKFVDCIGDLMGDYCTTAKVEMLMESKFERHTEEIACLAGARMVRTSEPEEGSRWNEALLKLLTGRDTISARRLYEKQFTFKPQFKLIMSGNFKPALKSTGEEIRRRMHFVEFPHSIPENERIYDLPERLQEEWPAILQWAIDGCIKWQTNGLVRPKAVVEATKEYLSDEDTLGQWVEDCCVVDLKSRIQVSDAYYSYKKRAEHHGEGVTSLKRFSQRIESRGFHRTKVSGNRFFNGIRLRGDYETIKHENNEKQSFYEIEDTF